MPQILNCKIMMIFNCFSNVSVYFIIKRGKRRVSLKVKLAESRISIIFQSYNHQNVGFTFLSSESYNCNYTCNKFFERFDSLHFQSWEICEEQMYCRVIRTDKDCVYMDKMTEILRFFPFSRSRCLYTDKTTPLKMYEWKFSKDIFTTCSHYNFTTVVILAYFHYM
jgi:hypothetical protein